MVLRVLVRQCIVLSTRCPYNPVVLGQIQVPLAVDGTLRLSQAEPFIKLKPS